MLRTGFDYTELRKSHNIPNAAKEGVTSVAAEW